MTREEAIDILRSYLMFDKSNMQIDIALNMAIEALSSAEVQAKCIAEIKVDAEDIYTRITGLVADKVDVVRCKDCIHQDHCHETVAHTRHHDDFIEYWSETIEWCSRGERREP